MNKDRDREWNQLKEEYHKVKLPENGPENMKKAIERAEKERAGRRRLLLFKKAGAGVAAALVIAVLLPNVSADVAMAMERVPVLRDIVKVVTLGRYNYKDERHEANVEIPGVELAKREEAAQTQPDTEQTRLPGEAAQSTADTLNKEIEDYINPLVEDFKAGLEEDYVKTLDISYEVVTDTDAWFTLRIDVLEIQASGYMYSKYYHIDRTTGERASLKDLFAPETDYVGVISENIKSQMREQMAADEGKIYFLEDEDMPENNFDRIKEDQSFYFNEKGELVIVFDEYEVAPGYMGPVRFTVPKDVTKGLLRQP